MAKRARSTSPTPDQPVRSSPVFTPEINYEVEIIPKSRSRSRRKSRSLTSSTPQPLTPLFGSDPSQPPPDLDPSEYKIKPESSWKSMRKYKNFIIGDKEFTIGSYVMFNYTDEPVEIAEDDSADYLKDKCWIARVLEIRAADPSRVFLRVFWCYWPDELPGGRREYHGHQEIVLSNHLQIVDAQTVACGAELKYWDEENDEETLGEGLFWRQKFDFHATKQLSELRKNCKCRAYYNPDRLLFFCKSCDTWLHESCLQSAIKRNVAFGLISPPSPAPKSSSSLAKSNNGDGDGDGDGEPAASSQPIPPNITTAAPATSAKSLLKSAMTTLIYPSAPVAPMRIVSPTTTTSPTTTMNKKKEKERTEKEKETGMSKTGIEKRVKNIDVELITTEREALKAKVTDNESGETWMVEVECLCCGEVVC